MIKSFLFPPLPFIYITLANGKWGYCRRLFRLNLSKCLNYLDTRREGGGATPYNETEKGGGVLDKVGEVNAKGGFNWPSTSLTLGSLLQPRSRG